MNRFVMPIVAAFALAALSVPAAAQSTPQGSPNMPLGNHLGQNTMTQEEFNNLQEYADTAKRLTKEDKAKGLTLEDLLAQDKATATAIAKAMPLSCVVAEAMLAAQGPVTVDGKTINTKTYEAVCTNGMGYFLVSQDPSKPNGISCLAADAARAADVAAGTAPGPVCRLPANTDIKAMTGTVLSRAGTNCTVREIRAVGVSSVANAEFNEVACTDGSGYILKTALPGSIASPLAITCYDATMKGLPCKLTDSGAVTLQTLKDALAQNGVVCDASNIRAGAQEKVLKRYVVELQCPQYPKGLVALIPLKGNTAKFETLDCAAAAKRGITCSLAVKK